MIFGNILYQARIKCSPKFTRIVNVHQLVKGSTHNVVVNWLEYNIIVSEVELQSRYYVHFQTNTLGKGMTPPLSHGLKK